MATVSTLPTGGPAAPVQDPVIRYSLPNIDGEFTFNVLEMPDEARLEMLKGAVRSYIANRVNAAHQRHVGLEEVKAWKLYDVAKEADPLNAENIKPAHERPADPDLNETHARALEDLRAGNMRRKMPGEPKAKKVKDPVIKFITDKAVRDLFDRTRESNPKYTFFEAKSEVGVDGVQFLMDRIEQKVAEGADREGLEKMFELEYMKPARLHARLDVDPKTKNLPSLI